MLVRMGMETGKGKGTYKLRGDGGEDREENEGVELHFC